MTWRNVVALQIGLGVGAAMGAAAHLSLGNWMLATLWGGIAFAIFVSAIFECLILRSKL
jgi:hypothetical protein